jgi:hypothetical protein
MEGGVISFLMDHIFTVLGTGVLVVAVQAWFNRKKTGVEVTQVGLDNSIRMENLAVNRYFEVVEQMSSVTEKLRFAESLLNQVKDILQKRELYISDLEDILDRNGIQYSKQPKINI